MSTPFIIFFLNLGSGEMFFIVLMILIFFGADKLPEIARGLGKGIREVKNATAEIQREIENSSAELQREMNIGKEMDELKDAANSMSKHIAEGVSNLEKHYTNATQDQPEKNSSEEKKEEEKENPLTPPDAIKRD